MLSSVSIQFAILLLLLNLAVTDLHQHIKVISPRQLLGEVVAKRWMPPWAIPLVGRGGGELEIGWGGGM